MDEKLLELLTALHRPGERQGPGSDAMTERAIEMAGLDAYRKDHGFPEKPLQIADIGCGTGAASLVLAGTLHAQITAVDFLQEFLDELNARASTRGLTGQIETLKADMAALPFEAGQFDVIWSEGAIYNMGFEAGVRAWRPFLKPGGMMVLTEITWLTANRPQELQTHWDAEYPEIGTASEKIRVLEEQMFSPIGYAVMPEDGWMENYYVPLRSRFDAFLARFSEESNPSGSAGLDLDNGDPAHITVEPPTDEPPTVEYAADYTADYTDEPPPVTAADIVQAEEAEIALYEKYRNYFSYGLYVAQKTD